MEKHTSKYNFCIYDFGNKLHLDVTDINGRKNLYYSYGTIIRLYYRVVFGFLASLPSSVKRVPGFGTGRFLLIVFCSLFDTYTLPVS